jgi:hypothetical protein
MRYVIAIALVGCTAVNDPGSLQRDEVRPEEYCGEISELVCEEYESCCPMPIQEDFNCVDMFTDLCREGFDELLGDPRVGYDPVIAAEVLTEGYAYILGFDGNDECDLEMADWFADRDGFLRFLSGTVPAEQTCTPMDLEDAPALFSCASTDLSCQIGATGWFCRPRHEVGEGCLSYLDCRDGLRCDGLLCARRLPPGEPCMDATDCQSLVCEDGGEGQVCQLRTDRIFCGFLLGVL